MDQTPQDQNSGTGNPDPSKNSLNLDTILLPKKEVHSVDSAQRVDAGTLLNQEKSATLPEPVRTSDAVSQPSVPPSSQDEVSPLQTFQGDIAGSIQTKGTSVVSIAAAEAARRGTQPVSQDAQLTQSSDTHPLRNILFGIIGFLFLAGAGGVLVYALVSNAPLPAQQAGVAPFIAIDASSKVSLPASVQGKELMQQLTAAKQSVSLSLGLVSQLYIEQVATSTDSAPVYMNAQSLLSVLTPNIPSTLLRDLTPVYLLGVHSFGTNQPFLILKVDSYEQAYAGMLTWEGTMKPDLSPLFAYVPLPAVGKLQQQLTAASSTGATTTAPAAPVLVSSSTTATSTSNATSTSLASSPQAAAQASFSDAIVENHDARVTYDQYGTIDFLWTFLDRQTLVITTNPDTLHEIIVRLNQTPITTKPAQ